MKIYKVTLEPLDWFFFGGESTFDNSVKTSYIAHSDKFPQQTALLGMVRYQLLKQEELLTGKGKTPDPEKVNNLIGSGSFYMTNEKQKFGAILGLSPVFIEREDKSPQCTDYFFPITLTKSYQLSFAEGNGIKVYLNGSDKTCLIEDNDSFKEKDYDNFLRFQSQDGQELMQKDIFETKMQVGITKNTDYGQEADSEKNRFFKHEMVRFKNISERKFRFAFYVALNEKQLESDYVYLGAERSCFKMVADEVETSSDATLQEVFLQNRHSVSEKGRIEILSPTYVENMDKLNQLCDFHWSSQLPFRNILQSKENKGKLNSGVVSYNRCSICYNMLTSGSVLFFDEKNRLQIEELLKNQHLQFIGYNYYNSMDKQLKK